MRYKVVEDPRVARKARSLFVRERARYLDIKKALGESPHPGGTDRISQLDFDDGLSIYSFVAPAFALMVVYTIREPDAGDADGEVRIITLVDRDAEQNVRSGLPRAARK